MRRGHCWYAARKGAQSNSEARGAAGTSAPLANSISRTTAGLGRSIAGLVFLLERGEQEERQGLDLGEGKTRGAEKARRGMNEEWSSSRGGIFRGSVIALPLPPFFCLARFFRYCLPTRTFITAELKVSRYFNTAPYGGKERKFLLLSNERFKEPIRRKFSNRFFFRGGSCCGVDKIMHKIKWIICSNRNQVLELLTN